jgi:hypothetical protein
MSFVERIEAKVRAAIRLEVWIHLSKGETPMCREGHQITPEGVLADWL